MKLPWAAILSFCAATSGASIVADPSSAQAPTPAQLVAIKSQVDSSLQNDVLSKWYPAAVDPLHGGFVETFGPDWKAGADTQRSIVYQSRLTWVAAEASERFPAKRSYYRTVVRHGVDFLSDDLWDKTDGGFFWATDPEGNPTTPKGTEKHTYGISFAIYACSEAYRADHDKKALKLAKRAFLWLDEHAHDSVNGGYYEALDQSGNPILAPTPASGNDEIGTRYGDKSMNTHIHLLEAFTNLYSVWPDPHLRVRLSELLGIVRDKVAQPDGYLAMFFKPNWTLDSTTDSYGHDIETAYLLTEATAVLGAPDDTQTWSVAKHLVDHALQYGYDGVNGGFFDQGQAGSVCSPTNKVWWEQAEGLNALLLMQERYGSHNDMYWNPFVTEWSFIKEHQIDPQYGGWYSSVQANGSPIQGLNKSDSWTDPYHQGRALMNVSARLARLSVVLAPVGH